MITIAYVLMCMGAFIIFASKLITEAVLKKEPDEVNTVAVKICGFILLLVASIIIFL